MRMRRGAVTAAVVEYLRGRPNEVVTAAQVRAAVKAKLGTDTPDSSIRSALQNTNLIQRHGLGRYTLNQP